MVAILGRRNPNKESSGELKAACLGQRRREQTHGKPGEYGLLIEKCECQVCWDML